MNNQKITLYVFFFLLFHSAVFDLFLTAEKNFTQTKTLLFLQLLHVLKNRYALCISFFFLLVYRTKYNGLVILVFDRFMFISFCLIIFGAYRIHLKY